MWPFEVPAFGLTWFRFVCYQTYSYACSNPTASDLWNYFRHCGRASRKTFRTQRDPAIRREFGWRGPAVSCWGRVPAQPSRGGRGAGTRCPDSARRPAIFKADGGWRNEDPIPSIPSSRFEYGDTLPATTGIARRDQGKSWNSQPSTNQQLGTRNQTVGSAIGMATSGPNTSPLVDRQWPRLWPQPAP